MPLPIRFSHAPHRWAAVRRSRHPRPWRGRWAGVATLVVLLGGFGSPSHLAARQAAEDTAPLRVCLLANNPPFSVREDDTGFDVDVARSVAADLGRAFAPVWVAHDERITEVDESDFPLRALSRGDCDALFSVPGPDAVRDAPEMTVGRPYYGAAFALMGRAGRIPASVREVEAQAVAVQAQTIAGFILEALAVSIQTFFSTEEALDAVADGKAELAFVWGPTAGWYAKTHPEAQLGFAAGEPLSVARWNEHVATRETDAALRDEIDAALTRLRSRGTLQTLAERYGVPWYAPFETTYDVIDMLKLARETATNDDP